MATMVHAEKNNPFASHLAHKIPPSLCHIGLEWGRNLNRGACRIYHQHGQAAAGNKPSFQQCVYDGSGQGAFFSQNDCGLQNPAVSFHVGKNGYSFGNSKYAISYTQGSLSQRPKRMFFCLTSVPRKHTHTHTHQRCNSVS